MSTTWVRGLLLPKAGVKWQGNRRGGSRLFLLLLFQRKFVPRQKIPPFFQWKYIDKIPAPGPQQIKCHLSGCVLDINGTSRAGTKWGLKIYCTGFWVSKVVDSIQTFQSISDGRIGFSTLGFCFQILPLYWGHPFMSFHPEHSHFKSSFQSWEENVSHDTETD